eukprot:1923022-Rhodomonas_salina.3
MSETDVGHVATSIPVILSFLIFFAFKLVAEFVLINLFVGMFHFGVHSQHHVKHAGNSSPTRGHVFKRESEASADATALRAAESDSKRGKLAHEDSSHRWSGHRSGHGSRHGSRSGGSSHHSPRHATQPASKRRETNLSCAECWDQMTNGGRHDFILIEDVQILMRMLPQPLGFARDALGVATMTQSWLNRASNRVRHCFGVDFPVPTETGIVTFDETFLTLFHWRCPELIPEEVRRRREPMLEEVAYPCPIRLCCFVSSLAPSTATSRSKCCTDIGYAATRVRKQQREEGGQMGRGAATAWMLAGSVDTTQEDMQRDVERKKEVLAAKEVGASTNTTGQLKRSASAMKMRMAMRRSSLAGEGDEEAAWEDERETEVWANPAR